MEMNKAELKAELILSLTTERDKWIELKYNELNLQSQLSYFKMYPDLTVDMLKANPVINIEIRRNFILDIKGKDYDDIMAIDKVKKDGDKDVKSNDLNDVMLENRKNYATPRE